MFHGSFAVLEMYSEWCGPCTSVLPTLKRLRLERDDEACLKFLTASRPPESFESTRPACKRA